VDNVVLQLMLWFESALKTTAQKQLMLNELRLLSSLYCFHFINKKLEQFDFAAVSTPNASIPVIC